VEANAIALVQWQQFSVSKTYFTIKEPYEAAIPMYLMARCMKKRGWRREESERLRVCALERAFFPPPGPAFSGNKGAP
jgi:hypothetical protein